MFLFRDPIRLDKPEPLDPVQAELERRILFAPPGHTGPFPTYEEVRTELAELVTRGAASARALTLSEAGFGPGVHVVVVRDLDGGVERIERAGTDVQPPPDSAKAEHFQAFGGAVFGLENVECGRKDTTGEVLRDSAATAVEIVEVSAAAKPPSGTDFQGAPSLVVKSGTSPQPQQKLQRPRRQSKPDLDFISKTRSKPKPKTEAQTNAKPKRDRTLTISPEQRASAERSFFVAEALGCPFNMKADLNPGLDHLGVEEKIEFYLKIVKNYRAYARGRCDALGMPYSWWPDVWALARESTRGTNLEEHVHFVFYAPPGERRRMVKLMEEKRKATDPKVKKWCENAKFALIDSFEHWTGWKFESAFGYFAKMADPQDYHPDSTIGYKKSGFITGPRIKMSPFLTNPEVVEATRVAVQALMDRRDANRAIMRANGSKPARDPRSLPCAPRSAPADVHAEIVSDVPAAPEPAIVPAAVEPAPIEPDTCLTPGPAGPVHRDEAEHRGMDVVEVEVRPAVSAPVLAPRELDAAMVEVDAGAIPAAIDAVVQAEDAAPPLPASAAIVPAVGLATATPAVIVSPDMSAEAVAPTPAPVAPTSASSSPQTVLAALGRAVLRGAAAGVGWIASRLGARPPLSPTSAARRSRAPMFDAASLVSAGAFFGAPDIQSDAW